MGSLTLTIQYQKNTGNVFSPVELINLYFFGTPPKDRNGNTLSDEAITFYIEAAQKELQDYLDIKLVKTYIKESRDYVFDDWVQWGYMPTSYPVVKPLAMQGFINSTLQIDYPASYLKSKTQSPDKDTYHREINLVPGANGSASTLIYYGISPSVGYFGNKQVPHYWTISYLTGFDKIPPDLLKAIGYMAALPIFVTLSDSVFGPGVASKSIGIDGLSQSVSTTTGGVYAARIKEIRTILDDGKGNGLLARLKSRYLGIVFGTL